MKSKLTTLFCFCSLLAAQEFRATLAGRITDPSAAGISGARIEIKSAATGTAVNTISGEDGGYLAPYLNPGNYSITVEKAGFHRLVRDGITLGVSEHAVVDLALTLGDVSQS